MNFLQLYGAFLAAMLTMEGFHIGIAFWGMWRQRKADREAQKKMAAALGIPEEKLREKIKEMAAGGFAPYSFLPDPSMMPGPAASGEAPKKETYDGQGQYL